MKNGHAVRYILIVPLFSAAVHNMQQLFPLIGILAGAVVAVIGLAVAVVILVVRVRRRRTQGYDKASAADMAVTDAYKETSSAADAASSSDSVDDNNPDIIPAHNSGKDSILMQARRLQNN